MYKNKRIYFEAVREGHAEILQQFYNDYDLQAGIESTANWLQPGTLGEIKEMIEGGAFRFVVKTLDEGQVIGFVSVNSNWIARTFEPMFFISRDHRGNGYGMEILELVLHIGFMEMNHRKACATVFSFNKASIKNLFYANFRQEGQLRDEVFRKGDYWDVLKFGLMIEEWEPKIQRPNMQIPEPEEGETVYPCTGCLCQECPIFNGKAEDPDEPGSFMECEGCRSCVNPEEGRVKGCKQLAEYLKGLDPTACESCACNTCHVPATECDECQDCGRGNNYVNFKNVCEHQAGRR